MLQRVFVWSGGALFAVALASCAWSFVGPWGRTGGLPVDGRAIAVDTVLFVLFAAHHSLFARTRAKTIIERWVPAPVLRSAYVWIASTLLLLVCLVWRPVGGVAYRAGGVVAMLLIAVQLCGLAITSAAVRVIDPLELAGIRQSAAAAIEFSGPYRWVRHPIYLGWLLLVFGTPSMTGDRLLFASISTTYLAVAIPWEERLLMSRAGDAYRRYTALVRWRMIPFIY